MDMALFIVGITLTVGMILGALVTYLTFKTQVLTERERVKEEIIQEYERKIRDLETYHARTLERKIRHARRQSTDQSRAVLKGKMAEQIAPMLPGFAYWPADARFLGNPVDYVVFNGYSIAKDNGYDEDMPLEIVILDIKKGKAGLTRGQQEIARALEEGRVRFEVVRVYDDGSIHKRAWKPRGGW
mgnify:CR=1 FL=1